MSHTNISTANEKNTIGSADKKHNLGKILCIGEALIDLICVDKGKSLSDGNNFLKKAGGAPTNVAAAIAALGGQVELVAKVGTDPFGKHLVERVLPSLFGNDESGIVERGTILKNGKLTDRFMYMKDYAEGEK